MTFLIGLKLAVIIIAILTAGGGILFIKSRLRKGDKAIKQNKTLKVQKQKTAKLNEEKKDVDLQIGEIEENLNNIDSDKLADSYNDKLSDKPTRSRRSRNK